jgi:hypothetical protein
MSSQMQLLQVALDPRDVVYTPSWVAQDMVSYFNPDGSILEPCCGDGVFLRYLSGDVSWCEIEKGKDFFAWATPVNWMVGNPPYKLIKKWLEHSFTYANNVLYLIPMNSPFNSMSRMKVILEYGNIRAIRAYGNGSIFGMDYGFAVGAFWFQKGYKGMTDITINAAPLSNTACT